MKSIIKSVTYQKEFKSAYGILHSHLVSFDNGDTGEINCKTPNPDWLRVGKELNYEVQTTKYGNKIKRLKEEQGTLPMNNQDVEQLKDRVNKLEEVVKQLVKHTGMKYVAPRSEVKEPVGKYEAQIVNAPAPYDEDQSPF